ncbi:MAG: phage terminase large subunit, partial [Rhodospirillales bacterium]|nr:phage terminase large subunit [Rhodospirillales bacterium]
ADRAVEVLARMRDAAVDAAPAPPGAVWCDLPAWAERLEEPRRWKALSGGRGSAKSRTAARLLIMDHLRGRQTTLCAREYMASIRASAHRLLATQIRELGVAAHFEILSHEIRDARGGVITFAGLALDPDTIRSMEGLTRVFLEEGHSLTAAGLEILSPTVRESGAEISVVWNPHESTDPVQALAAPDRPDVTHVTSSHADNPWLSLDVLAEIERDRDDPDRFHHVWEGGFRVKSSARVFRGVQVRDLDATVERLALPPRYGCDLGWNDPTAALETFVIPATGGGRPIFYVAREAYRRGLPVDQRPALLAGSDRRGGVDGRPRWANPAGLPGLMMDPRYPVVLDSAEPGTIELLRRCGLRARGARKGPGSVALGVERLQAYDVVVHPRCENAARELRLYSYRVDPKTGAILDEFDHAHSHVPDACRYVLDGLARGLFPSRRLVPEEERGTEAAMAELHCKLVDGGGAPPSPSSCLGLYGGVVHAVDSDL